MYPEKMGATTIWERWDGMKPDSTFQTPGMNSFNHYAYGAIGDWMYRKMVGIDTDESGPGYKQIVIKPHPGGGFTHAKASLKTYYGTLSISWSRDGPRFEMQSEVRVNTKATIYIPAASAEQIKENGKAIASSKDIKVVGKEADYVVLEAGGGVYKFEVQR